MSILHTWRRSAAGAVAVGLALLLAPPPAALADIPRRAADPQPLTLEVSGTVADTRGSEIGYTAIRVTNQSDTPIYGLTYKWEAVMRWTGSSHEAPGYPVPDGYANCYNTRDGNVCTFPETLEPKHSYVLRIPFQARDSWPRLSFSTTWKITAGVEPMQAGTRIALDPPGAPIPGDAPAQQLTVRDTEDFHQLVFRYRQVSGKVGDLAVQAQGAHGHRGGTVRATARVTNSGPVDIDTFRFTADRLLPQAPMTLAEVTVPDGVTVLKAPRACLYVGFEVDETQDYAQRKEFVCRGTGGLLKQGDTAEFPFDLRIDKESLDAAGTVTAIMEDDGVAANDTATYRLATGATGTPSATVSPQPSATAGTANEATGGAGGGLPITGSPVALIVSSGAVVLVGGVILLFLARRRKIRYDAPT